MARTVGALVGRAQRYVHDVKADIQREVNLASSSNCKQRGARRRAKPAQHRANQVDEARQAVVRCKPAERSQPDRHATLAEAQAQLDAVNQTVVEPLAPASSSASSAAALSDTAPSANAVCRRPRSNRPAPWLPPKPPRPFFFQQADMTDSQPLLAHLIELRDPPGASALIGLG